MEKRPTECSDCKSVFKDGQAVYSSPTGDKTALCEACATARFPKCEVCGEAAMGKVFQVEGKTYHLDCLKCTSCSQPYSTERSMKRMGKGFLCGTCEDDVKRLVGMAEALDEQGDRAGASDIGRKLVDMGIDIPPELLKVPEEAPPVDCVLCCERIVGKCGSIWGKSPVCLACGESVESLAKQLAEFGEQGNIEEAVKCAKALAAKGFDVPPELLEERSSAPKCAMCSTSLAGKKFAQVGDEVNVCENCADDLNKQFSQAAERIKTGDLSGAVNIIEDLKSKQIAIPKGFEDFLQDVSTAPRCCACSKIISGKYAQMGDAFICFDCSETVDSDIKEAQSLIQKGDSEGAAKIAKALKSKGVPVPDMLLQTVPKESITADSLTESKTQPKAEPKTQPAMVEPNVEPMVKPTPKVRPEAKVEPKPEEITEPLVNENTSIAGSGHNAAKALAKTAPKSKSKAAPPKSPEPSGKAAAKAKVIHKEVIGGGKSSGKLTASDVFVRIRPLAEHGGHADDGTAAKKVLDDWDDISVTIATQHMFSKGEAKYTFPRTVFGPESTQQDVYDGVAQEMVEAFTQRNGHNVLFFAYGQTGTGKTHTMLGTQASLASREFHEDWGIFPRISAMTFEIMQSREGVRFVLIASAIQFHMGMCNDLLGQHGPVVIDGETHQPSGQTWRELKEPGDLMPFLTEVMKNRATQSTKMNEGSSRSHAALILDLMQVDVASNEYVKTTFTLVDLAGAERPDKTGENRVVGGMCFEFLPKLIELRANGTMSEEKLQKFIPVGCTGAVINHELFSLGTEVLKAAEQHTKGKPYTPPKQLVTPTITFLSAILTGKAILSMLVCLSSASRNGWETWFSLQYGTDLSKLRAPLQAQKPLDFDKLCKASEAAAKTAAAEFAKASTNKYYAHRKWKAESTAAFVERLNLLR